MTAHWKKSEKDGWQNLVNDGTEEEWSKDFDIDYAGLDEGISQAVKVLMRAGIETYESCEGGEGHSYYEPTVRFHGNQGAAGEALTVAMNHGLPVSNIKRVWTIQDGESVGPTWEMVFYKKISGHKS